MADPRSSWEKRVNAIAEKAWNQGYQAGAAETAAERERHREINLRLVKALEALAEWCAAERAKLGAVDGYDYRSGEEFGLARAETKTRAALAAHAGEE